MTIHIAAVSGGKDSTAMCLHLKELGIDYTPVYLDTGWENAATYEYLREYLPSVIGEITWLEYSVDVPEAVAGFVDEIEGMLGHRSAFVRLILKKGMFSSRQRRYCTQYLKQFPMVEYLQAIDGEPVNVVGIRRAESKARSQMAEREWSDSYDCDVWRPLVDWSVQDVIDIHTRHGVIPNANYLNGARRVGCWPCIFASKKEIRHIADSDPDRIAVLRRLEEIMGDLLEERVAKLNTTLEAKGWVRSAWFINPQPKRDPITGKRNGSPWPIDRVIRWAKTKHGGRQYELFAPPSREFGCMAWGLCDMGDDK